MIQGRVGPELANILIKQDEVAKYVAKKLGVPEELIRSTEEMQAAAQQMQQMMQQQQMQQAQEETPPEQ
jgi:predicted PilT family ATPase